MRLLLIVILLSLLFAAPLLIFGDRFDILFQQQGVPWLRGFGPWAGVVGMGLLVSDLFLPVPSTAVMAALGILYGPLIGGLFGAGGSMLAGSIAYGATRLIGHRAAVMLVGEDDLARAHRFFSRAGGWAVAATRVLPLLAEVIACLAGLAGMPARRFFAALLCGSLPLGLAFAWLGHQGSGSPTAALAVSALLPLLLWPVTRWLMREETPAVESVIEGDGSSGDV